MVYIPPIKILILSMIYYCFTRLTRKWFYSNSLSHFRVRTLGVLQAETLDSVGLSQSLWRTFAFACLPALCKSRHASNANIESLSRKLLLSWCRCLLAEPEQVTYSPWVYKICSESSSVVHTWYNDTLQKTYMKTSNVKFSEFAIVHLQML